MVRKDYDVAVIGGGIAGLVSAYDCMRAGKTVLLLEKEPRLGGRIQTADVAGITVDIGAESFAARSDGVVRLAGDLGIEDRIVTPSINQSWFHSYDEKFSYAAGAQAILGIPDMFAGRQEPLAKSLGDTGYFQALKDLETPWDVSPENVRSMSLAELVEKRLGRAVVERLVGPTVKAVYAIDPYTVTADALVPGFAQAIIEQRSVSKAAVLLRNRCIDGGSDKVAAGENNFSAVMSFDHGMGSLVRALTVKLQESPNVDVITDAVFRRQWHEDDSRRLQLAYYVKNGREVDTANSGAVVNACSPAGSGSERNSITVVVTAITSERLAGAPRGTGVIAYGTDPCPGAKALTHVSAKWGDNPALAKLRAQGIHIVRLSYSRGSWESLTRQRPVADLIAHDASVLFGIDRIREDDVIDWKVASYQGTGAKAAAGQDFRQPENRCIAWVGHSLSGGSVTNIVADVRRETRKLIESIG